MVFEIYWTSLAEISYAEEIDFIFNKWNSVEVINFIELVEDFISKVKIYPYIGKIVPEKDIQCFVISNQTTVYYRVYKDLQKIDLILFHNNKQNPEVISKYF